MKSGDVAGAEALCRKALEADPDNAEIKMRYGICRELLGDEKTFKEIHDELAPEMAEAEKTEPRSEKVSLWRKYHKLWLSLAHGVLRTVALAMALLAPLVARADIVVLAWRPPTAGEIWTDGLFVFGTRGLPLLLGGGLLNWIYRRIRRRTPLSGSAIFRRWLGWSITLFIVSIVLSALTPRIEMGGGPRSPYISDEIRESRTNDETGETIVE